MLNNVDKKRWHPGRQGSTNAEPTTSAADLVRNLFQELPIDFLLALDFSITRALAVPKITKIFVGTSRYVEDTGRRHASAVAAVCLMVRNGLDSPDCKALVRRMLKSHNRHHVPQESMLYVFACLAIGMPAWFKQNGIRPLTKDECKAIEHFCRLAAEACEAPCKFTISADWESFQQGFEARNFAFAEENVAIAESMVSLVASRFPRPSRRLARALIFATMPADILPLIKQAPPSWIARKAASGFFAFRRGLAQIFPAVRCWGRFVTTGGLN